MNETNESTETQDTASTVPVCEICGSNDAHLQVDPYEEDIYNRVHFRWLCNQCAEELAMDI